MKAIVFAKKLWLLLLAAALAISMLPFLCHAFGSVSGIGAHCHDVFSFWHIH